MAAEQHPNKCTWTLRMPGNRSDASVPLTAESRDALVVDQICQDLGCGSVYNVNETSSPPNTTCFHGCSYHDRHLQNCSHLGGSECTMISEVVCDHQRVQLAAGVDRCAGRVEVWKTGEWGTVCDDQWDLRDADVVCAQLGCGYAISVSGQGGSLPRGIGPIHLDELNCTGTEDNLWACPAVEESHDCGHKEDAGVVCSEMRAVRLSGGVDRCSGKVEIHRDGRWGTVCDSCWTKDEASMVCSMLKCGDEPQQYTQFDPPLTHNNGTLWYYICTDYKSLWQCKEYFNHPFLCKDSKAAGVICNALLVQRRYTNSQSSSDHHNDYRHSVDLVKVTTSAAERDEDPSSPRCLWTQLSSADSTSVDTDYEQYDPSKASVCLSTFRNSQRYRKDVNPLMKASALNSLSEEGTPEPYQASVCHSTADNSQPFSNDQLHHGPIESSQYPGGGTNADEEIYSPVSPDCNPPSTDEEYDDIGTY
ncbi:T-cell differentiation antigen CD6-like [Diretmus argenteus]